MNARSKFLVGSAIIVITLMALAYVGFTESKTYYHTITELSSLQGSALHQRMRVSGNVRAGTIEHLGDRVDFVLTEQGKNLRYLTSDAIRCRYIKDGAQALVEGKLMPDNRFQAEQVQAKLETGGFAGCTEGGVSGTGTILDGLLTRGLRETSASHD